MKTVLELCEIWRIVCVYLGKRFQMSLVSLRSAETTAENGPSTGKIMPLFGPSRRSTQVKVGSGYGSGAQKSRASDIGAVPAITLRQLVDLCGDATPHVLMMDVQGGEARIFASDEAQEVLREHTIARFMVGIHGGNRTLHIVASALRKARYEILLQKAAVPRQPDGVVVAVSPRARQPGAVVSAEKVASAHERNRTRSPSKRPGGAFRKRRGI